ncbi:hypothetical protein ACLOJK_032785 [Asimina triloba]
MVKAASVYRYVEESTNARDSKFEASSPIALPVSVFCTLPLPSHGRRTTEAAVPRLPIPGGAVTGADLLRLADAEASFALFGLSLPENLKSAALRRMDADAAGFPSTKYSQEEASSVLRNYITAIADELADDPLVVSVLDGTALQLILDDEDDFAVLAENLFTDLDTEDTGKLSKSKIKNALDLMGVDMGVPPHCG